MERERTRLAQRLEDTDSIGTGKLMSRRLGMTAEPWAGVCVVANVRDGGVGMCGMWL